MPRKRQQPETTGEPKPPFSGEAGFVVAERGAKGIGKLIGVSNDIAEIEYFISPAGPRIETVSVPTDQVRRVELPAQTRVYWFDDQQHAWRIGRVDGGLVSARALAASEDHYHVRFPNRQDGRIPCSQLHVRWAFPIDDPTDHLAARITDSPIFYDDRRRIVAHLASQRASFGSLTGISSSAIEFFEHQVSIVRRVLADPIQRYLLADEVGLGKTIEAGALIRQHVLDHPSTASVTVVVPGHLVSQWKTELKRKFFLSERTRVQVVDETAIVDAAAVHDATMLVIDEAHRVALGAFSTESVQRKLYDRLRSKSR